MKNIILVGFVLLFTNVHTQTTGTITDVRDGKVYKTVVIGNQTWMAENLNVDRFRNGDPIPEAKTDEEWIKAGENKQPAWCYYNNDTTNGRIHGKLYNWFAVNDRRGLAPEGWHIPSKAEFTILINFLEGENVVGTQMKSSIGWEYDKGVSGNGTNSSGFMGLSSGECLNVGISCGMGYYGCWWSSQECLKIETTQLNDPAWSFVLSYANFFDLLQPNLKGSGCGIRCLKD